MKLYIASLLALACLSCYTLNSSKNTQQTPNRKPGQTGCPVQKNLLLNPKAYDKATYQYLKSKGCFPNQKKK